MKYSKKNIALLSGLVILLSGAYIFGRKKAVRYAKSLIGQTEISGNMGFNDPKFQKLMSAVGWKKGDAWCIYFAKVIWVNKFSKIVNFSKKLISGNSQITFENFLKDKSGLFNVSKKPKPNDIVIWQYHGKSGSPQQRGHGGIVTKVKGDKFWTIEGNTTGQGGSEGYIVAEREHSLNEMKKKSGLVLRGFIHYKYA